MKTLALLVVLPCLCLGQTRYTVQGVDHRKCEIRFSLLKGDSLYMYIQQPPADTDIEGRSWFVVYNLQTHRLDTLFVQPITYQYSKGRIAMLSSGRDSIALLDFKDGGIRTFTALGNTISSIGLTANYLAYLWNTPNGYYTQRFIYFSDYHSQHTTSNTYHHGYFDSVYVRINPSPINPIDTCYSASTHTRINVRPMPQGVVGRFNSYFYFNRADTLFSMLDSLVLDSLVVSGTSARPFANLFAHTMFTDGLCFGYKDKNIVALGRVLSLLPLPNGQVASSINSSCLYEFKDGYYVCLSQGITPATSTQNWLNIFRRDGDSLTLIKRRKLRNDCIITPSFPGGEFAIVCFQP